MEQILNPVCLSLLLLSERLASMKVRRRGELVDLLKARDAGGAPSGQPDSARFGPGQRIVPLVSRRLERQEPNRVPSEWCDYEIGGSHGTRNEISSQAGCRAQRPQDRESLGFPSTQVNW